MSEGEYTINVTVTGLEDVERLRKALEGVNVANVANALKGAYTQASEAWAKTLTDAGLDAGEVMGVASDFSIGDVVSLKSGGPRMTVESISEEEDGTTTAHCSWFALLSRDPAFPAWDQDGVRYASTASRGVFPADCLEF